MACSCFYTIQVLCAAFKSAPYQALCFSYPIQILQAKKWKLLFINVPVKAMGMELDFGV